MGGCGFRNRACLCTLCRFPLPCSRRLADLSSLVSSSSSFSPAWTPRGIPQLSLSLRFLPTANQACLHPSPRRSPGPARPCPRGRGGGWGEELAGRLEGIRRARVPRVRHRVPGGAGALTVAFPLLPRRESSSPRLAGPPCRFPGAGAPPVSEPRSARLSPRSLALFAEEHPGQRVEEHHRQRG